MYYFKSSIPNQNKGQMNSKPLDVFSHQPLNDPAVRKYELYRYNAEQPLNQATNPSEITVDTRGAALDNVALLERAYLQVKYKLYTAAGGATAAADNKSQLIQNGWSLFSRAALYIAGSEVERVDNPGVVSYLKRMITHTKDEILGQGPSQNFYPQQQLTTITLADNGGSNGDFLVDRGVQYETDRDADHWMKLNLRDVFGFCDIDKGILGGSIRLSLNTETDHGKVLWTKTGNSDAAYVRIQQVDLMLPICRPDNATLTSIYSAVKAGKTMPFEYEHWNYYRLSIPNGTTAENVLIPNSSKRPSAVVIFPQLQSQENTITTSKLVGLNLAPTSHRVNVDSKIFPEISFQGTNNGYLQEYETFLQLGNKHHQDVYGSFMDRVYWQSVAQIYCYDIAALRDELGSVRSLPPAIRWEATHADPGAAAVAHVITVGKEYKEFNMVNDVLISSAPDFRD